MYIWSHVLSWRWGYVVFRGGGGYGVGLGGGFTPEGYFQPEGQYHKVTFQKVYPWPFS